MYTRSSLIRMTKHATNLYCHWPTSPLDLLYICGVCICAAPLAKVLCSSYKQNYIKYLMIRCARFLNVIKTQWRIPLFAIHTYIHTFIIQLAKQPEYFSLAIWAQVCACKICQYSVPNPIVNWFCLFSHYLHSHGPAHCITMCIFIPFFPRVDIYLVAKSAPFTIFPYLGYDCILNSIFSFIYRKSEVVV